MVLHMKVEAKAEAGEGVPQEGQPQRRYGVKQGRPCEDVAVGSGCQRAEATGRTGWGKECAVWAGSLAGLKCPPNQRNQW